MGVRTWQIEKLQAEATDPRNLLAETKMRIEQLSLEKNVGGRISVMSYGEVPVSPEKDKRKALAAVGGLGSPRLVWGLYSSSDCSMVGCSILTPLVNN